MKKYCKFLFCCCGGFFIFCGDLFADGAYLVNAQNAWVNSVPKSVVGASVATDVDQAYNENIAEFYNMVSLLAYNDTGLNILESFNIISGSYGVIDMPLAGRRRAGQNILNLDADVFAVYDKYDSNDNDYFKVRRQGASMYGYGFVNNGLAIGLSYTYSDLNSRDTSVDIDGTGNSLTLFSKYLGKSGAFINMGVNGGRINWELDKVIAGVENSAAYDTDFVSGQVNTGVQMQRNRFIITPQMFMRYVRIMSEKHTDDAAQEFGRWWYNTLTAGVRVDLAADFSSLGFLLRPSISLGAGYDLIKNGTDSVNVNIIGGGQYLIPIVTPNELALMGAVGIDVFYGFLGMGLQYKMDMRSNYLAQTAAFNLKVIF